MNYCQMTDCKKWQFLFIPEFTGGKMSGLFTDCSAGLAAVPDGETDTHSFMHLFTETETDDITAYVSLLENQNNKKIYENTLCDNLFYQFETAEGLLYISFFKNSGITRIILDRCPGSKVADFGYSFLEYLRDDTVFVQYSLHYDKMIRGTTCDCGMNYIIRLRDNSLIIIDGGEFEQATNISVDDYMNLLHSLTQTAQGEKMSVSLWLCTHAHNDHCDFFSKLIRFHKDELEIERTAFNFPLKSNIRHSDSVKIACERIRSAYPEADYIKLHAGSKFNISNARFEILTACEDAIGTDPDDPFPCTNATSLLFTVDIEGRKLLFLADCCNENGDILAENYSPDVLNCDFLQAAHHGINEIYDVYEKISADRVLLPQCKMNMDDRFSDVYSHLCGLYGEENIFFSHDATTVFSICDGKIKTETRPHVGVAYDGSEW